MWKKIKVELVKHKSVYVLLFIALIGGFYLRVYGIGVTLGFYFDQGRDAKVIADLIDNGKFFLIGPTTGIAGIFRGPFYWLGKGNPVWPSVFLSATTVLAAGMAYYLGTAVYDRKAGLIAAAIASFSFFIVVASRWLSNPTPMLLISMLFLWSMFLALERRVWGWIGMGLFSGFALFHFGSAGELFYLLAILVFVVWRRKHLRMIWVFYSALAFLLTAFPLAVFDFRHDHLLSKNIAAFIFNKETFKASFGEIVQDRVNLYYDEFTKQIFHPIGDIERTILLIALFVFLLNFFKLWKNDKVKILLLVFISPLVGLLFFQGNAVYGYYLTGYYLIFVLILSVALATSLKYVWGGMLVAVFFYVFLTTNIPLVLTKYSDNAHGPETVMLGNQKRAIDWIYQDAEGKDFSVDVYVPPVIPHAYDYLFVWIGEVKYGHVPSTEQINPLYILYEADSPHPDRLEKWLLRQEDIGETLKEEKFGGITVQKRMRI